MNWLCYITHNWGKWEDTHRVTSTRVETGALAATGVRQIRHCERCGKVESVIVWDKEQH